MPTRRSSPQPAHREVLEVQRRLAAALASAQVDHDPARLAHALAQDRADDATGLAELLADLDVATPSELAGLLQVLCVSASYTALSWARGVELSESGRLTAQDVLSTSWAEAVWEPTA